MEVLDFGWIVILFWVVVFGTVRGIILFCGENIMHEIKVVMTYIRYQDQGYV